MLFPLNNGWEYTRCPNTFRTEIFLWQFRAEYVLNAFWDLRLIGGFSTRVEQSALHRNEELYFFFGISSDITRPFDDF
ncbi:MAG: hypothetical protein JKX84_04630 [Flavobacteriales bacterium]|nr:hypothetical protein [Flavobacteriales bacterium]